MKTCGFVASFVFVLFLQASHAFAQDKSAAKQEEPEFRVYYIQHASVDQVMKVVDTILAGNPNTRMSMDARTNSIIVMGSAKNHEKVKAVLEQVDVPTEKKKVVLSKNVAIQVIWAVDIPELESDEIKLRELPAKVKDLLHQKLVDRLSLTDPKLGTQLYLKCETDEQGKGSVDGQGNGSIGGAYEFSFKGNAYLQSQGGGNYSVELDLQAKIDGIDSVVSTTIQAKEGHPVCLAVAPIGGVDSLFIIQIFED